MIINAIIKGIDIKLINKVGIIYKGATSCLITAIF